MGIESSCMLESAVREVLICPNCGGSLSLLEARTQVFCQQCSETWPIRDGIIHLMRNELAGQESERRLREETMKEHRAEREQILATVGQHHCLKVMYERA